MSFPFQEVNWQGLLIKVKSECLNHTSWLSGSIRLVSHVFLKHVLLHGKTLQITHLTLMQTLMVLSFPNQIWRFVCDTNKYVLWAVFFPVKLFVAPHACFLLFSIKHKGFYKCRVCVLGKGMMWVLTNIQAVKIRWDCECTVTFLKGIWSGNYLNSWFYSRHFKRSLLMVL